MKRLLSIEWQKSWNSKYFKIMLGIWLFAFIGIPIGAKLLLVYMESQGFSLDQLPGVEATDLPIFDFVDIWQNLTYVYKCITIFLAILMIINITNELDYKTFRQNVIDGMSKTEFLKSKLLLILILATIASLLILILGLVIGHMASPATSWAFVTKHINFVGAYWLHIVLFLLFSVILSLLIKRAGLVIAILMFYMYVAEPIASGIMIFEMRIPNIAQLLPMQAVWNLIPRPIEKYALMDSIYWVSSSSVLIATAYIALYLSMIWLLLVKRDIK